MEVVKRDGSVVSFDLNKIRIAIEKANKQTEEMNEDELDRITGIVLNKCDRLVKEKLGVEEIQDIVEDTLLKSRFNQTAKAYILFREDRTRYREKESKLMKTVAVKLMASNVVNQNANVDEKSFGGRKGEANNEVMKWFALNNCMKKKSRENHQNNEIYIHRQNCGIN